MILASLALAAPDEAAAWEPRLRALFAEQFAPAAVRAWIGARPEATYAVRDTTRWGPDALNPGACLTFLESLDFGPADNGYRETEVAAARAALGPDWRALPTGFDGWAAVASFRRHPGNPALPPHLRVSVTQVPAGFDLRRMFDAGIAQGCGPAKASYAFLWSGDTLVRLDAPCSEGGFARWTRMVADVLPTWTGQPLVDPLVFGECGTIAIVWTARAALDGR